MSAEYERGEPPEGFPCWCGFFTADYVCNEHLPEAELLMKIHELESIIWDGTRQVAELETALREASERDWKGIATALAAESDQLRAALQQASQCCARPRGVCFDPDLIDGSGGDDG